MSKSAEDFAAVISGSWSRAVTKNDWFQLRSWCHGARIMAEKSDDKDSLRLLFVIAEQRQKEAHK